MNISIAIAGIDGQMGREIISAANETRDVTVSAGLVSVQMRCDHIGLPCVTRVADLPLVDVLVDFTSAEATLGLAIAAVDRGIPFVSGVTGLTDDQLALLRELALRIPIFHARNFSLGLNVMLQFLPSLVRALDGYDIEIVETHHRRKLDAPSGSALALAEAIGGPEANMTFGREGVAPRQPREIGIHAVRGGGNTGEHTVLIMDDGEEIRICHRSLSRRTFALGALRAARFIADQPPGFYGMADLVGPAS